MTTTKTTTEVAYTHYLAVVPNYWGKGPTIEEAKKALRRSSGFTKGATIYQIPADYYIDDWGDGHGSGPAKLLTGKDLRS